jgi:hypothetical protein
MAQMIRKQVYLEPRQDRMVKRRARQRGVTEAEIIREALDEAERAPAKLATNVSDPAAGRKAFAFMRSLAERGQRASRRTWNRESLYADRIDRWQKS